MSPSFCWGDELSSNLKIHGFLALNFLHVIFWQHTTGVPGCRWLRVLYPYEALNIKLIVISVCMVLKVLSNRGSAMVVLSGTDMHRHSGAYVVELHNWQKPRRNYCRVYLVQQLTVKVGRLLRTENCTLKSSYFIHIRCQISNESTWDPMTPYIKNREIIVHYGRVVKLWPMWYDLTKWLSWWSGWCQQAWLDRAMPVFGLIDMIRIRIHTIPNRSKTARVESFRI
jgi:hypothetical protein